VIANLPDARDCVNRNNGEIVWTDVGVDNEFGNKERFTRRHYAEGKVIVGTGRATRNAWLDRGARRAIGKELWRWYVVPKPGDPGAKPGRQNNAWKTGARLWQVGPTILRQAHIWGTGTRFRLRSAGGLATLYTNRLSVDVETGKLAWYFHNAERFWDFDEVGVTCCTTRRSTRSRRSSAISRRNGFYYSIDRNQREFLREGSTSTI